MKIKELVDNSLNKLNSSNIEDARTKLFIILKKVLNHSKETILIHLDDEIDDSKLEELEGYLEKITKGIPVQYLVNEQEFYGLKFFVDERVLIPQPDTECLVEEGLDYLKSKESLKVLDLCTGSGAIAISIAKNAKAKVYASDISKDALEVARINANNLNADITFIESNIFERINEKFDLIISNPPYIKTDVIDTLSEEVKHEPIIALDGKEDGLFFYKEIARKAKDYLNDGGKIMLEIGFDQREEVEKILQDEGYININSKKDLAGLDRIVSGEKKGE